MAKLKTTPERGIDGRNGDDLNKRVIKYVAIDYFFSFGSNRPQEVEAKSLWEYIIENFEDEMLRVLCLAAGVALITGVINEGWKEVQKLISTLGLARWSGNLHRCDSHRFGHCWQQLPQGSAIPQIKCHLQESKYQRRQEWCRHLT